LDSTSSQLGSYLLRGWRLLDQSCGVCYTPMLRSPAPGSQLLCVKCGSDTTNTSSLPNGTSTSSTTATTDGDRPPAGYHPFVNGDDMDSDEEEQEAGVIRDEPVVQAIANGQIELGRREQSDRASKLIGEKLLQGYCLLDELCPTPTCFGIPLLRLPRETERRTCVICEKIYPEVARSAPATVIPPPAATSLPSIQPSLGPRTEVFTQEENEYNRYSITRSYMSLAGEMNRLTGALGKCEPGSREYNEMLGLAKRVTKITCMVAKLVEDCK